MKLIHLRDVLAVAECGSLRAAGRHLNIAQPAITRSIHEIERELGVSLFERTARGVRPTAMGEAFLRRAKSIESDIRRATEEIEQLKGRSYGQVSVAMSSASAHALMPSAITAFRKRFPDGLLKISEAMFQTVEPEVLDGQIDFYVGPIDPNISTTQLHVEKLFDVDRVVVARKGHPLAGARSILELKDAQWVRPALSTRSTEADFEGMFPELGLESPAIVMHAHSTLVTLIALANSDLLTVMPSACLEIPPTADGLTALDLVERFPPVTVSIVRRHDMPLTPMAEHLCDLMRRAAHHYASRKAKVLAA
ncbi:MAG: LysR substrate-binding domain-containing protein [bacterium]|nr:LysR substrate-binding domain-containing protein [bacterium]